MKTLKKPTPEDPLRVVELFSGIGAQAMALKRLGIPYVVVGTSEINEHAMKSYEAIHGPVNQLGDITKLEHLPECDLVTYSFPCLTGDTHVLTSKGWTCIRDIEVGDCVYSHDGGFHRVISSGCTGTKPTLTIEVDGLPPIRCTENHPFRRLVGDDGWEWALAGSLREGDVLRTISCDSMDGDPIFDSVKVVGIQSNRYEEKVYDLTVERTESFYVQGGVETHNCQDLSVAGMQRGMERGSGTRSALLWEVGRLIKDAVDDGRAPEALLMENVNAILNKKNIGAFKQWISYLTDLGYTSSYAVLNATDFGVPQNRKRCFMVSTTNGLKFRFPEGHPTDKRLKDVLEDDVPESYYLSDEKIAHYEEHKRRHDAKGHGLGWEPRTPEEEARPLTALPSRHSQNFIVTEGSMEEYRREHSDSDGDPGDGFDEADDSEAWDVPDEPTGNEVPGIQVVGNIQGWHEHSGRVHSDEGYAPSVMANRYSGPSSLVLVEDGEVPEPPGSESGIILAGHMADTDVEQARRVYSPEGNAPSILAVQGSGSLPKIQVKTKEGAPDE